MSLYKDWLNLIDTQNETTFPAFWENYAESEARIYTWILTHNDEAIDGTFIELANKFDCDKTIFAGFLDGINDVISDPVDLEGLTEDTAIHFTVDFEKLYVKMHTVDAEHLYTLEAWDNLFSEDEKKKLLKEFKQSRTVHKEKKPGRNDPCPCGSGKKYKKCCGKNA